VFDRCFTGIETRVIDKPEIHYSPGEDLERVDLALIGEAAK
jgi:hypothetical protein